MTTIAAADPFGRIGDRARAALRGRADDPVWARPALAGLLVATAVLYLADLAASGYANSFYSAAVQAGSHSWKAVFFGSFDSSNFITVDKPPASLWVMDISARLFGVSSWSILVPQALEGVAAVALLYATVRRRFSAPAALLSATVFALTPVAALMFRFNNPDALLTLLLVGAAYAVTRALERAGTRWLVLAGVLIGFGFLTKMMQSFIVVPGFAAVYLLAAPAALRRRLVQLLLSGVAMFAAAAWWVAIVAVWPAGSRPYIGGSQDNSILNLIFGYNGFGRITGNERGSVVGGRVFGAAGGLGGGPGNGSGMWGPTGITRLFGGEMGTQISWLLPAALFFLAVLLVGLWRGPRTDGRRAAVLIWGSWLVVTGLVFSFAQGIIHPYYTVALAPAIGALVGIGVVWTWARRYHLLARLALAVALAGTAVWTFVLLDRTPSWHPALRYFVLILGLGSAVVIAVGPPLFGANRTVGRAVLLVALAAALAAPAAYSAETASTAHAGALPTAGPSGSVSGPGAGPGGRRTFGPGGAQGVRPGAGAAFGGPPGGFGFSGGRGGTGGFGGGRAATGGLGGLLDTGTPAKALTSLLEKNASSYRWVAAIVGANSAAGVQLATNEPVMAIGGFNGTDPTPTLAQFELYVVEGKIHYFLASGGGGAGGGGIGSSSSSNAIASWVEQHFTATTVGGQTVYDLSQAAATA
ncbi:MAG TPA: glycosyltransferase family 39 protein [Gaiellaceae bacterium]|jgi:4-amino-4-deoxy-L-arabinose transferase-like glycosyltransferase|nr:glycosyltransferase family 39 protein [Gaiellaceae bacterium]